MQSQAQAVLKDAGAGTQAQPVPVRALVLAAVAACLAAAAIVLRDRPFESGAGLGYALGIAGGSLMLVMLLYPVRKRLRAMQGCGALRHWFRLHMVAGILGPLLVLFHSTFRVGSLNAAVALGSMLLVVASGLVGRFLYRRIHHGLYGRRATLEELRSSLERMLAAPGDAARLLPPVRAEIDAFAAIGAREPAGWAARLLHGALLPWRRRAAARRARRAMAELRASSPLEAARLQRTVEHMLGAIQQAAQFQMYERLFALWHVVHVPFLFLLVITAVVHVVAVHAY